MTSCFIGDNAVYGGNIYAENLRQATACFINNYRNGLYLPNLYSISSCLFGGPVSTLYAPRLSKFETSRDLKNLNLQLCNFRSMPSSLLKGVLYNNPMLYNLTVNSELYVHSQYTWWTNFIGMNRVYPFNLTFIYNNIMSCYSIPSAGATITTSYFNINGQFTDLDLWNFN